MTDVDARCVTAADGWICEVTVAEHGSESRHSVTLPRKDFQRLARAGEPPESLVRRSFEFLLAREPKEAILGSFELPVIGRFFPEFEAEIKERASPPG